MNDEIDLLDKEISENTPILQRPVFITVLCILTFVGVGFSIISSIFGIFTMSMLENVMTSIGDTVGENDDFSQSLDNSYRWSKIIYILSIIGSIICLVGALLMWKLRKLGYFIYIVGQITPLIGTVLSAGSMSNDNEIFGNFGVFSVIISMFFPIAFLIMYGLNLKHMK